MRLVDRADPVESFHHAVNSKDRDAMLALDCDLPTPIASPARRGSEPCRLREAGRWLPDGLDYVDSRVEPNFSRCSQLMRCDDLGLFQKWALNWRGYGVSPEIVPVVPSAERRAALAPWLDKSP